MMADLAPLQSAVTDLETVACSVAASGDCWPGYFIWRSAQLSQDGSLTLPYPNYGPKMEALWEAFTAAGFDAGPADYLTWLRAQESPYDPSVIERYERSDIEMLLLAVRRGERFGDGHWAAMLKDGVFLAVAKRCLELGRF